MGFNIYGTNPTPDNYHPSRPSAPTTGAQPQAAPVSGQSTFDSSNPYNLNLTPTWYEDAAGVVPPGYQSLVDANGNLKSTYAVDPTKSDAFQQYKTEAMSTGPSAWAQLQQQSNALQGMQQLDKNSAQALGSTNQATQQMMATGGGSNSGASAFLAAQGARNAQMANQNTRAATTANDLNIQTTDAQNKQQMLGAVADKETGALSANTQSAINDALAANAFSTNRYNEQMSAWGAGQTANQQSRGGKK